MKHLLLALLLFCACSRPSGPSGQVKSASTFPGEVYFSPKGGCTDAITKSLGEAKKTILVQAYELTAVPIGDALGDAQKRGVMVQVLVDRTQEEGHTRSVAPALLKSGVAVKTDDRHRIAHNKVIVIDDEIVITGSFNFTPQAETEHSENLLVIRDKDLAKKYAENWKKHHEHSREYAKK